MIRKRSGTAHGRKSRSSRRRWVDLAKARRGLLQCVGLYCQHVKKVHDLQGEGSGAGAVVAKKWSQVWDFVDISGSGRLKSVDVPVYLEVMGVTARWKRSRGGLSRSASCIGARWRSVAA